jgi:PleD family two-component response regulator
VGTLTQVRSVPGTTAALHVLVVLGDAKAARAHSLSLQLQGCRVSVATHVRRAVELAVEELPDLILTDAGDLLRQLLAADPRTRQIPILAGGMA